MEMEKITNEDMRRGAALVAAFRALVQRCDTTALVDGSSIDTCAAHAALNALRAYEPSVLAHSTPAPYRVCATRSGGYEIHAEVKSRNVQQWEKETGKEGWGEVAVCSLSHKYNGSGEEWGPKMVYSAEEAAATAEFIVVACNTYTGMVGAAQEVGL